MIHFDAHSDLWPDDNPRRIDHGTMFYKAVKAGCVDPKTSVQIGIRTTTEDYLGVNVITAREAHEMGVARVVETVKGIVGTRPTYLTFDIDALDPAFAPAPARRSGAGWPPGRWRRCCAIWPASTLSAATWSRSLRPMTPPGPPRLPAPMWPMS